MLFQATGLAAILLAGSSLALPAPGTESTIVKKGFTAPAHRYIPKRALVSRETGTVKAKIDGGGWIMPVTIGGQTGIFNLDTGSSDLWTASTLMPADQQKTVTSGELFDPSKSKTFEVMEGSTYNISYLDGSGSSGEVGIEKITIGGASVPNMPFGVCNDLRYSGGGSGTRDTDGPIGLGFGSENSIRPKPQGTFMEFLIPHVPEPVFSTSFKLNDSGSVDFGFNNTCKYTGAVTTIPISNTTTGNMGQWIARDVKYGSGGKVFSSSPVDMEFDSGTASLNLPPDAAAAYFALVPGSSNSSGSWEYPCGTTLPNFDFVFSKVTSGPSTVTIPGEVLKNDDAKTGMCGTWVENADETGYVNAGLPFYISKYMIWNQALPSLSFADQSAA